jgi:hypothetical protein
VNRILAAATLALALAAPAAAHATDPVACLKIYQDGYARSLQLGPKETAYNAVMTRIKAYSNPPLFKDMHSDDAHDLLAAVNAVLDALLPVIDIRMNERSAGCVASDRAIQADALLKIGNDEAAMMEQTKFGLIAAGVK